MKQGASSPKKATRSARHKLLSIKPCYRFMLATHRYQKENEGDKNHVIAHPSVESPSQRAGMKFHRSGNALHRPRQFTPTVGCVRPP
ncbi:hypothetical protein ACLOJK_036714, partial [Asimina triloba]